MKASIKLGKIYGIEIGLHYSWLIIAVLISLSLSNYFAQAHPDWTRNVIWALAVSTSLLFFLAIVLHELSHSAIARWNGLPVRSITLYALGGVAQIEKEPEDAKTEFWLGIIGPLTSTAIGSVCLGFAMLLGWTPIGEPETPIMAMLVWLGYVNIALAIFNMVPGFPMDGGRVFRAIVWQFTGNADKATRIASAMGQYLAISFIFFGILLFFNGAGIGGLWIAFIGWFLLNAAKASYLQVELTEGLSGVTVKDLMSPECPVLEANTSLRTLVNDYLLRTGQRCFMVIANGEPVGMITPQEITKVEQRLWAFKTVSDSMRPFDDLHIVPPEMPVAEALEIIGREGVNQLPVVTDGRLKGLITREQIINYLFTRQELNL